MWHPPICDDLQIFYDDRTLRRVTAIVREVDPSIILTHSPQDYMEDHMNTCRLAVTAAFARGMPELSHDAGAQAGADGCHHLSRQPAWPAATGCAGAWSRKRSWTRQPCRIESARRSNATAVSSGWLDATQGMSSYLVTMEEFCAEVGIVVREIQVRRRLAAALALRVLRRARRSAEQTRWEQYW